VLEIAAQLEAMDARADLSVPRLGTGHMRGWLWA